MCMKCQQLASQLTTAALSGPSNTVNPVALQANAGSVPAQNITATALSIPSAATNNLNQADITAPTTPSASPAPTQAPSISATKSAPSDPNVSSSNVSASSSQAQPNNLSLAINTTQPPQPPQPQIIGTSTPSNASATLPSTNTRSSTPSDRPAVGPSTSLPTPVNNSSNSINVNDKDKSFPKLYHLLNEFTKELKNPEKRLRDSQIEVQRLREKCQQLEDHLILEQTKTAALEEQLGKVQLKNKALQSKLESAEALVEAYEQAQKQATQSQPLQPQPQQQGGPPSIPASAALPAQRKASLSAPATVADMQSRLTSAVGPSPATSLDSAVVIGTGSQPSIPYLNGVQSTSVTGAMDSSPATVTLPAYPSGLAYPSVAGLSNTQSVPIQTSTNAQSIAGVNKAPPPPSQPTGSGGGGGTNRNVLDELGSIAARDAWSDETTVVGMGLTGSAVTNGRPNGSVNAVGSLQQQQQQQEADFLLPGFR